MSQKKSPMEIMVYRSVVFSGGIVSFCFELRDAYVFAGADDCVCEIDGSITVITHF